MAYRPNVACSWGGSIINYSVTIQLDNILQCHLSRSSGNIVLCVLLQNASAVIVLLYTSSFSSLSSGRGEREPQKNYGEELQLPTVTLFTSLDLALKQYTATTLIPMSGTLRYQPHVLMPGQDSPSSTIY